MIETFRALRRDLRAEHIKPSSVMLTLRFANESDRWHVARAIGAHLNALSRIPEAHPPQVYAGTILEIPFELAGGKP
jgi:hypothetical protein